MTQAPPQPKSKRVVRRPRGLPLTIWIIVVGLFGVGTAVLNIVSQPSALGLATSAFVLICAWGLWGWQRWAYFSLLVAISIAGAILLLAAFTLPENVPQFIVALAAGVITVALIQPRLSDFR